MHMYGNSAEHNRAEGGRLALSTENQSRSNITSDRLTGISTPCDNNAISHSTYYQSTECL